MEIKRTIAFKTRPIGKDKDIFQIRMRVSFLSKRIDFKTGTRSMTRVSGTKVSAL